MTGSAVSRAIGVPRSTVRDWLAGRVPRTNNRAGGCPRCATGGHAYDQLPDSYAYLLGLYLGDGSISSHPRGVYKLRITLDARYPGIIEECARAMEEVIPASKVARWARPYGDVEVYSYSKAWPCLFPQHGPGKKHLRRIVLVDWQTHLAKRSPRLLLRGLIHSDGCRFENTGRNWRHPRYSFCNLSPDIRRIFCNACAWTGLRWTLSGDRTVYVSRKDDVRKLDEFVGPKA